MCAWILEENLEEVTKLLIYVCNMAIRWSRQRIIPHPKTPQYNVVTVNLDK